MAELDPNLVRVQDALRKAYALSQQPDLSEQERQQKKDEAEKLAIYLRDYKPPKITDVNKEQEEALSWTAQVATIPDLMPEAIESFMTKFQKRVDSAKETQEAVRKGIVPQRTAGTLTTSALAVGIPIDILSTGVETGLKTVSILIPDSIGEPVANTFKNATQAVLNTELGRLAVDAIQGGAGKYKELKKENPESFKAIETTINFGLLFAPAPKASPVSNAIGSTGTKIVNVADEKIAVKKKDFIDKLIQPPLTKDVLQEQLKRTTVSPILQTAKVAQSADEIEMSKIIQKIPEIGKRKTIKHNWLLIRKDLFNKADKLVDDLERFESGRMKALGTTGRLEFDDISKRLNEEISTLIATNPLIRGQKPLQDTSQALLDKTLQLLKDKPLTPANVLRARQDLDKFIQKSKGNIFSAVDENALSIPFKTIRRTLNNIIDEQVPSASVKQSLREQSLLYDALENITPKAIDEGANIIGRSIKRVADILPYNEQRNIWLANLAVLGTFGTAYSFPQLIPYVAGGLATYGAARSLYASTLPWESKKLFGQLLQGMDKAIKTSKNTAMIQQLKADRIYIAELLKNIETESNQEKEENTVPALIARPQ
jgi:hypothetical protein